MNSREGLVSYLSLEGWEGPGGSWKMRTLGLLPVSGDMARLVPGEENSVGLQKVEKSSSNFQQCWRK